MAYALLWRLAPLSLSLARTARGDVYCYSSIIQNPYSIFIVLDDDKLGFCGFPDALVPVVGFIVVLLLLVCWFLWLGYFKFHSHFTHFCALCESLCSLFSFLVWQFSPRCCCCSSRVSLEAKTLVCFLVNFGPWERGCPRRVFVCFFLDFRLWTGTRFAAFALPACGLSIFTFAFTFTFLFSTHAARAYKRGRGSGALKHNGNG